MARGLLIFFGRLFLALVFIGAGLDKIQNPGKVAGLIESQVAPHVPAAKGEGEYVVQPP